MHHARQRSSLRSRVSGRVQPRQSAQSGRHKRLSANTMPYHPPQQATALLLQGPVGPFFSRIASELSERGFKVLKINFNGGDRFFYSQRDAFDYRGTVEAWETWVERFICNKGVTRIYLFGDCRVYHRIAKAVAARHGVRVFVFEEGYVRPNFITLEEGGVNGHSSMMEPVPGIRMTDSAVPEADVVKSSFYRGALYAMVYYWASAFQKRGFPHYQHHRPFDWFSEGSLWLRSAYRKRRFRRRDQLQIDECLSQFEGQYFVCPLQVHCDMQVLVHSQFNSIEHFIGAVMSSFAEHAPPNRALVFKHHPMDRGYTDYTRLIANMKSELGLQSRVFYVHDVCLPSLLRGAVGSVMINSTVGLSSLFHGAPVKVLGDAIYDRKELTFQGALDEFWQHPGEVDASAFARFRNYLVRTNQLNGNFYTRIDGSGVAGVRWSEHLLSQHQPKADIGLMLRSVPTELRLVDGKTQGKDSGSGSDHHKAA